MKTLLWLLAVAVSGAAGFYFGFGYGAKTLGTIAAQNEVMHGVNSLRVSLQALQDNKLERSNQLHEQNLKEALLQIGSYSSSVTFMRCSDKDREVMQAARKYAEAHPDLFSGPLKPFQIQGLGWCGGA
jgi:hypothetical protein